MSKVPSFVRQKNRVSDEEVKRREKIKEEKMQILERAFKERKEVMYLTDGEIKDIKKSEILCIHDLFYINNKFKGDMMTYGKILAKVLVKMYKLYFITENEVYEMFKENFVEDERRTIYAPLKLETKLTLMNLIFEIKNSEAGKNFFGIKTNFIAGTGKKNVILYGSRYAECSNEIIEIINEMKLSDNISLIRIVNKIFQSKGMGIL
jgi:hypothetical protein